MMLILAVSCAILGAALARCPPGSLQGLNAADCYKQSDAVDSWYGAEDRCRMHGGHLASVSGGFANAFLRDFALWNATDFWLGANEDAAGAWTWTDGLNVSYTNWALGQPCSSRSMCLSASTQNGLWLSRACSEQKPYFCKLPAELAADGANTRPASATATTTPAMPTTKCQWDAPYTSAPPPPAGLCNAGWTYNRLTKNCWQMATDTAEWPHMLNKHCLGFGNAISIHSPEVNCAVAAFVQAHNPWFLKCHVVWIGLHGTNRQWQWTDNSTVDYVNWAPGGDRHCSGKGDCGVGMWLTKVEKFGTWVGYDDGVGPDVSGEHVGWEPMLCVTETNF